MRRRVVDRRVIAAAQHAPVIPGEAAQPRSVNVPVAPGFKAREPHARRRRGDFGTHRSGVSGVITAVAGMVRQRFRRVGMGVVRIAPGVPVRRVPAFMSVAPLRARQAREQHEGG